MCPIRNQTHPAAVLSYLMYMLGGQTRFGEGGGRSGGDAEERGRVVICYEITY